MEAPARTIVLVEGASDRLAVIAAARRLGADLEADATIRSLHGITNLRHHLDELLAPSAAPVRLFALYDANELAYVARVLTEFGVTASEPPSVTALEPLGFFGCIRDLEDEVIRAAGPALVEATLADARDLTKFRTFRRQPAQRDQQIDAQLHRFAGTAGGRKARFSVDIIDRLPVERIPRPLVALIGTAVGAPDLAAVAPSPPLRSRETWTS